VGRGTAAFDAVMNHHAVVTKQMMGKEIKNSMHSVSVMNHHARPLFVDPQAAQTFRSCWRLSILFRTLDLLGASVMDHHAGAQALLGQERVEPVPNSGCCDESPRTCDEWPRRSVMKYHAWV